MIWLIWQYARIVVNVVLLVLDVCGITVCVSKRVRERTIRKVAGLIEKSPGIRMVVQKFITALKNAWGLGNAWEMAKAIFQLLSELQAFGILWTIIESLCSDMSMWDWATAALQVSLMIIATLASDGCVLIAKIAGATLAIKALIDLINSVM